MVRTRGLGRALGKGAVLVAEDELVLPADEPVVPTVDPVVASDEPMIDADVQDTGAEAVADEPEGFLGGPRDALVLTKYANHVAASVWSREERPELKLSSYGREACSCNWGLVAGTGVSPLIACSVDTGDQGLISSFVERWHRETSSFHLPIEEVTITLDNVASLLHLSVVGAFHSFQPLHVDEAMLMLVDLLLVSGEAARAKTRHCHGPYSATHVHVVFLDTLRDLSQTGRYAWGAAALVHMYDHLNDACISSSRQLAGYITLLQCIVDPDYDEVSLRACRWIAMKKTVKTISTETYRQHLDRLRIPNGASTSPGVLVDFMLFRLAPLGARCCQTLTRKGHAAVRIHPVYSCTSFDEIDDRWMHYSYHLAPAGEMCVVPGQCAPDYIDWFLVISHPFVAVAQPLDPPRDAPATHHAAFVEPHRPQEACQVIAERLERHLNLRIVTPGTKTHEIIEQCLRIARGVTEDRTVYVRSRRRRRTDQL
ncbi:Protein MAIN-LIKE 1 [Glycine soja]